MNMFKSCYVCKTEFNDRDWSPCSGNEIQVCNTEKCKKEGQNQTTLIPKQNVESSVYEEVGYKRRRLS